MNGADDAGLLAMQALVFAELPTTRTLTLPLATLFKAAPCAVNIVLPQINSAKNFVIRSSPGCSCGVGQV
jgi:hypothetical protein